MLLLELFFTLAKGILIGILVSAPMGPTGLLCLRETTRGRRRDGMLVGLGATLSDLVYGLIAYWGVGIVLNLLDQYSSSLRLGGSIFILGFCVILLTRHVSPAEDDEPAPAHRLKSAYSVKKGSEAPVRRVLCCYGRDRYRLYALVDSLDLHRQEALGTLRDEEPRVDQ